MASAILDFGSFTNAQLTTMLSAAQAEYLLRITTGRVKQGGSAAQSYGLDQLSVQELIQLINGLTTAMGMNAVPNVVQPNFNSNPAPLGGSVFGAGGGQ